jgi:acetyl esterase/lipase
MKKQSKSIQPLRCRRACGAFSPSKLIKPAVVLAAAVGLLVTAYGAIAAMVHHHYPTFANVPYAGPNSSASQTMDLYTQQSPKPLPLVMFVHGGGWISGDKSHVHRLLNLLLSHGFDVASIDYRLTKEATWPAQINDTKAAIRFVRANAAKYNIDPDRIGLWGMSAGGQLVALAGTAGDATELEGKDGPENVSSRVQAVVDWYGPTDFTPYASGKEKLGDNVVEIVERLFGGPITDHPVEAKAASATAYVSPDDPPMLIMHGTKDPLVPLWQSETLADAMKKAGVDARLVVIKDAGHVMFGQEYLRQVVEFFESKLKATAVSR